MANDVTLKIDADNAAYLAKVKRMEDAHGGVNNQLKKHGDLTDLATHGLARHLLKAAALFEMVRGIAEQYKKVSDLAAGLSRKDDKPQLALNNNLRTLGFTGQGVENAKSVAYQEGGAASEEERLAFVGSLADIQRQRKADRLPQLTQRQIYESMNLFRQGGAGQYGEGGRDITDLLKDPSRGGYGVGVNDELGGRLKEGVSEEVSAINAIREIEFKREQRTKAALREKGQDVRLRESAREAQMAENPFWAYASEVGKKADFTGIFESIGDKIQEAVESNQLTNGRKVLRQDNPHDEGKP